MKRALFYLAAPALCLALYWNVLFTWFLNDDFRWLSLRGRVHSLADFLQVLFTPYAQGTVRVLSERVFFLLGTSLFGIHALPFRVVGILTWFLCLALAAEIGSLLVDSRAAGLLAALFWTASYALVTPLSWSSSYNQLLCSLLLLAAFYARLRWLAGGRPFFRILEWIAFLLAFGALEIAVMYPVAAIAYTWAIARRRNSGAFLLFLPSATFTALHFLLIPRTSVDIYKLYFDARLPGTLWSYLTWSLGPSRLGELNVPAWDLPGRILTWIILAALVLYTLSKLRQGSRAELFGWLWFLAFLAPVLPLANHISDYYLTLPLVGLSWVAGSALTSAWQSNLALRVVATMLALGFLAGSAEEIQLSTRWFRDRGERMRSVYRLAERTSAEHPGTALLFEGVDNDLFQCGFEDAPFELLGISRVYLASDKGILAREDLGGLARFHLTPEEESRLRVRGELRVLRVVSTPQDITAPSNAIDAGSPAFQAGPGWYPAENGARWMSGHAELTLPGSIAPGQHLYLSGYGAAPALAQGPVEIKVTVNGAAAGAIQITHPGEAFSFDLPLPGAAAGAQARITLDASRTFRAPGDPRDLAMIFGTFEIR